MPVLPAVPSTTSPPGFSSPRFSASRIICRPARSLTDWPGFMNSALPRMVQPVASEARFKLDQGRVADGFDAVFVDGHVLKLPVCLPNRWATLKDRSKGIQASA